MGGISKPHGTGALILPRTMSPRCMCDSHQVPSNKQEYDSGSSLSAVAVVFLLFPGCLFARQRSGMRRILNVGGSFGSRYCTLYREIIVHDRSGRGRTASTRWTLAAVQHIHACFLGVLAPLDLS
ncbi:hypothetical protein M440DRAFT_1262004 [Trichoderma longibrachiatum ATCC 18648]|uniref:Uncharacterized protein n=1 Tax=Trichoderma longibrachiatum ATCC 18648 TaxID=983965 RepID=A0A2T4C2R5_TRILO|nr:hypothetical protein M440DRAFT_1262004 [Trichoderma longibrachiatum ATCC 18648]